MFQLPIWSEIYELKLPTKRTILNLCYINNENDILKGKKLGNVGREEFFI